MMFHSMPYAINSTNAQGGQVAKLGCVRIGDGVMLDTGRSLKDKVMNT